jgi:hypothetical protein
MDDLDDGSQKATSKSFPYRIGFRHVETSTLWSISIASAHSKEEEEEKNQNNML